MSDPFFLRWRWHPLVLSRRFPAVDDVYYIDNPRRRRQAIRVRQTTHVVIRFVDDADDADIDDSVARI